MILVTQDKPVYQALLDDLDSVDHKEQREVKVCPGHVVMMDLKDKRAKKETLELQDDQEEQDHREPKVIQV